MNDQQLPCEIQGNFKILKNGDWLHDGVKIARLSLVKLFSTILKQDDQGQYWLENPVEKVKIEVEEVPFIITQTEISEIDGSIRVRCITNIDEQVDISNECPITLADLLGTGRAMPYVRLPSGHLAKFTRAIYYQLVDLAVENPDDPDKIGILIGDRFHILGDITE